MNKNSSSSDPSSNQDQNANIFSLLISTAFGKALLAFICLITFYLSWTVNRVDVGSVSIVKGENTHGIQDTKGPLFAFQEHLEDQIEEVYTLENSELEKNGYRTGYSDTLNFILLELLDIRFKKLKLIKSECSDDKNMDCLRNKIAEKNTYITTLIQKSRVPLSK